MRDTSKILIAIVMIAILGGGTLPWPSEAIIVYGLATIYVLDHINILKSEEPIKRQIRRVCWSLALLLLWFNYKTPGHTMENAVNYLFGFLILVLLVKAIEQTIYKES